jgi:hypothetical protein
MAMPAPDRRPNKTKTTFYMDADVLLAAKTLAAATRTSESQLVEDAVRAHVQGRTAEAQRNFARVLGEIAEQQRKDGVPELSDDESLDLAYQELRAMRAERGQRSVG